MYNLYTTNNEYLLATDWILHVYESSYVLSELVYLFICICAVVALY